MMNMMDNDGPRWKTMEHHETLWNMIYDGKTWTNDYGGYMLQGSQERWKSGGFDVVNTIIFSFTTIFVGLCNLLIYGLLFPESLGLPGNPVDDLPNHRQNQGEVEDETEVLPTTGVTCFRPPKKAGTDHRQKGD
jgi:hypothetical protein